MRSLIEATAPGTILSMDDASTSDPDRRRDAQGGTMDLNFYKHLMTFIGGILVGLSIHNAVLGWLH